MKRGRGHLQAGLSLIEVLVALVIFAIGLLGLAGLILVSMRSTQTAYLRTQVVTLAEGMGNRMRANAIGVWDGSYNQTYPLATPTTVACSSSCTSDQMAQLDTQQWNQELSAALPNATANIACNPGAASPGGDGSVPERPPYAGNCRLSISWSERGAGDTTHTVAAAQTFNWIFQP